MCGIALANVLDCECGDCYRTIYVTKLSNCTLKINYFNY